VRTTVRFSFYRRDRVNITWFLSGRKRAVIVGGTVRATPADGVNFTPYMKLLGVE
jgi:hypothetical protein